MKKTQFKCKKVSNMKIYIIASISSGKSTLVKRISKSIEIPNQSLDEIVYIADKTNPWGNRKRPIEERDNLFYSVIHKPSWVIEDTGRPCFKEGLKDRISPYKEKVVTLKNINDINKFLEVLL